MWATIIFLSFIKLNAIDFIQCTLVALCKHISQALIWHAHRIWNSDRSGMKKKIRFNFTSDECVDNEFESGFERCGAKNE